MRAIVVDDHVGVAEMTSRTLGQRLHCTMLPPITSFAEGMALLPSAAPDVIVLDHMLGDGRGVDLHAALKGRLPEARWLLYTAFASATLLRAAIGGGIDGTVSKRASVLVLALAVKEVLAGRRFYCEITAGELRRHPENKQLTPTELRILPLIAAGLEAKEIAAEIGLTHKTILNDLVSIRHKTGAESMVEIAEYAKRHGLAGASEGVA